MGDRAQPRAANHQGAPYVMKRRNCTVLSGFFVETTKSQASCRQMTLCVIPLSTVLVPQQGTCLGHSPCSLSLWERELQAQRQRCSRSGADKIVDVWVANCQTC